MIRLLSIIAVLGLTGCATASNTYLKNGKQGLSIDCSGEAMSWASCYEKADASCAGTGYEIVGTDGTPQPQKARRPWAWMSATTKAAAFWSSASKPLIQPASASGSAGGLYQPDMQASAAC